MKRHESKSSKKGTTKEEIKLSSKPSPETRKTSEKKEKSFNDSLSKSALVASALVSNAHFHSSLRPKRRFHSAPLVEKILSQIKKIPSFSTSFSLLLQYYPSKEENFHVKKEDRLFKNSQSHDFPGSLSIKTGKTFATKKIYSSKKLTSLRKVIRIKYVFKRNLGSKSFLIAIESSPHCTRASISSCKH